MAAQYILDFGRIDKEDIPLVGGKGANLGEMTQASFPVPPGFAVTTVAYDAFMVQNELIEEIQALVKDLDTEDSKLLQQTAKKIQQKILRADIPVEVAKEAKDAYAKLSGSKGNINVAVRSSATAEDLPGMSFAGQQATFLNIKGTTNLLVAIRECWASLFTARAIFYRAQNKIPERKVKISVIVQKMIQSKVSGVMFTVDPVTSDKDRIVIESVWGLGEMIVQGSVTPDTYVVQKDTFAILSKVVSDQTVMLTKVGMDTKEIKVPEKNRPQQKITDADIVNLAKIGQKLQEHYFFPQDVEWAKEDGELYIVQTRPVTTIGKKAKALGQETTGQMPILTGAGASPGIASGEVNIVDGPQDISKVHDGDVLVAKMTSPDYVPAMKKASAIVTDEGGQTSHAAIVSRELGIPAVVGTKNATKLLKSESVVTVDGAKGLVFAGGEIASAHKKAPPVEKIIKTKTKTRVYVNLGEPEMVAKISKKRVDGVGLLRAEFMIANIGIHPKESIKQKTQGEFINKLTRDLTTFCKGFSPRPVVYRATDFKTNEYRALPGGKAWEPEEPNPLLGFRGAYRYLANPDAFNLELEAIKNVRRKYKNLWLMIPFVRSPEELAKVRRLVEAVGLFEDTSFKFWMMVELPINVILIEDFIKVGIDGVSIGSNDLTMLVTGTDRDNPEVSETFNERSKAIYWSLRRVIRKCNQYGVTSSICGQAPSSYEDLVQKLVKYGITSISVNPDAINRVRGVIAQTEKELIS